MDTLRALRRAETVTLHHEQGLGSVRVRLDNRGLSERPRAYTDVERRLFPRLDELGRERRIDVDANIVGVGAHRWDRRTDPGCAAFHLLYNVRHNEVWRSIVRFLRPGDVIRLDWRATDGNGHIAEAGLHADEVRVAVDRGRRSYVFLLAVSVCADNGARMVRRRAT